MLFKYCEYNSLKYTSIFSSISLFSSAPVSSAFLSYCSVSTHFFVYTCLSTPIYSNLNPQNISDNKIFWTNIKPFFSGKGNSRKEITLVDGNKMISSEIKVADTLQHFEKMYLTSLSIPQIDHHLTETNNINDSIEKIIKKFSKHPSILKINETVRTGTFNFKHSDLNGIHTEILNLKSNVACPSDSISSTLLKDNIEICREFLLNIMKFGITNSTFDDSMKLADITPIFKKDEIIRKENYRPISCLPAGSKIFERILQNQINSYIEIYLSPFLCGYRKGYCAQYAVMTLLEKWRISIDKKGYGGAILLDLSKTFDSLNHELLVAKLHAYGFSYSSLELILPYLSNRWQRTKINNTYSSWVEILLGVPQGSILGPLQHISQ